MPIKTQNDLPAKEILEKENVFVMDENRAIHQNIRQLEIAIVKLFPPGAAQISATTVSGLTAESSQQS